MGAQAQAGGVVVPDHRFASGRGRQRRSFFGGGRVAQQGGQALLAGGVPELLTAVAAQAQQRVGSGQVAQLGSAQACALGQVGGAVKCPTVGARGHDALGHRLRQAADQTQAQAHGGLCLCCGAQ